MCRAPAKLNLGLRVLARRADGYHEIETVFLPLDLCDDVEIECTEAAGIHLDVSGADLPTGVENLAVRAAALACRATGLLPRLRIRLAKRIPVAAGLGGGSSDAAAVLRGIRELAPNALSQQRWQQLALEIGADVPFFLDPRPSIGRGRGERLELLPEVPEYWWLLIAFRFAVSTAEVYRRASSELTLPRPPSSIAALWAPSGVTRSPENDLEAVTSGWHPEIASMRLALRQAGAHITGMSGSGPTVYGQFEDRTAAERAVREVRLPEGARAIVARSFSSKEVLAGAPSQPDSGAGSRILREA